MIEKAKQSGVVSGSVFWGLMAATGVSAVLKNYPGALVVLRLGGLYLLFLAFKAARAAVSPDKASPTDGDARRYHGSALQAWPADHLMNQNRSWPGSLMFLGLDEARYVSVVVILAGCAVLSVTIFCGYAIVFRGSDGPPLSPRPPLDRGHPCDCPSASPDWKLLLSRI